MQLSAKVCHFTVHECFLIFQNFCLWDLPVCIVVHLLEKVKSLLMTRVQNREKKSVNTLPYHHRQKWYIILQGDPNTQFAHYWIKTEEFCFTFISYANTIWAHVGTDESYLFSCWTVTIGCNPAQLLFSIQLAILILIIEVFKPYCFFDLPLWRGIPWQQNKVSTLHGG